MEKTNLLVLFGGVSTEHEVSCMSAAAIINNIDKERFSVTTVGITKSGRWLMTPASSEAIKNCTWDRLQFNRPCCISTDRERKGLIVFSGGSYDIFPIDCVFPVLHGKNGEDGTIQGIFEIAGLPYVGCGVGTSSNSMDKTVTKLIAKSIGLTQAEYYIVNGRQFAENPDETLDNIIDSFNGKFPLFVKPSRSGSSVGVSKVSDKDALSAAIVTAAAHDDKIIVEEYVEGKEVEVAVLGNNDPVASVPGEILKAAEFYDYNDKYINGKSSVLIPASLPADVLENVQGDALKIYKALDGLGLSRVDFFVKPDNTVVFNEINTMPGFTSISMYPKLFEFMGIDFKKLVTFLVDLALEADEGRKTGNMES